MHLRDIKWTFFSTKRQKRFFYFSLGQLTKEYLGSGPCKFGSRTVAIVINDVLALYSPPLLNAVVIRLRDIIIAVFALLLVNKTM